MAKPSAPAPDIMADVSPQDGSNPSTPPDGNPDGPIPLPFTPDQLSKFGVQGPIPPGSSVIAMVRLTSVGTDPNNPQFELTAVGQVQPDDGTADLVSLGNDSASPVPDNNGSPESTSPIPGLDDGTNLGADEYDTKRGGASSPTPESGAASNAPEEDEDEKILGYKPKGKMKKSKPISAKGALGDY